jgi:hypothetical protein
MKEAKVMLIEIGDFSLVDIVRAEKKSREKADGMVRNWQREIGKGDCFKMIADGLEIYGEVLRSCDTGEFRNVRVCRCYSLACPEGETGSVHVATIDKLIDRKTFEKVTTKLRRAWKLALNQLAAQGCR